MRMTSRRTTYDTQTSPLEINTNLDKAPVLDYKCLFTRDVLRKQKRWQDGRLKFHTFNKRVMVHDERSNFVGDLYRQEDGALEEGEELSLERSGVLVEVGEYIGKRDQDLNQIVLKKIKIREENIIARPGQKSPSSFSATIVPRKRNKPSFQYSHGPNMRAQINKNQKVPGSNCLEPGELKYHSINHFQGQNRYEQTIKRRKSNFSSSSTSHHTQNSAGSTAILSSIPTSSKASIQEPIRTRPLTLNPCSITIDLTKGDRKQDELNSKRGETGASDEAEKHLPAKESYSPCSKSKNGYATHLTGAQLTLSNLRTTSRNRLRSNIVKKHKDIPVKNLEIEISASAENDLNPERLGKGLDEFNYHGFASIATRIDTTNSPYLLGSSGKLSSGCRKQIKRRDSILQSVRSSSPAISEVTVTLEDSDDTCKIKPTDESMIPSDRDQVKSTLRIKSRPPRKMMFLEKSMVPTLAVNNSRPPDLCFKNHSKQKNKNSISSESPTNVFCRVQNTPSLFEGLQSPPLARNDAEGNAVHKLVNGKLDKLEDLSPDIFIDLQTNHTMLSSRNTTVQPTQCEEKELSGHKSDACEKPQNNEVKNDLNKNRNSRTKLKESISSSLSSTKTFANGKRSHEERPIKPQVFEENQQNTYAFSTLECKADRLGKIGIDASTSAVYSISEANHFHRTTPSKDIKTPPYPLLPNNIQPEEKSSSSVAVTVSKDSYFEETAVDIDKEKNTYVKNSPSLPYLDIESSGPQFLVKERISNIRKVPLLGSIKSSVEISKAGTKVLLSNPATRGKPLQVITSSTVDALNAAPFIDSSPSGSLSEIEETTDESFDRRTSESYVINSSLGPWSRESFDLLGISKPPWGS